jgi:class I fructose-bisphosphate aldolase
MHAVAIERGSEIGPVVEDQRDVMRATDRLQRLHRAGDRRIVVFSGGEAKDTEGLYKEVRALRDGGANGSIIGRNTFQRPRAEALDMLDKIIGIYQGKM